METRPEFIAHWKCLEKNPNGPQDSDNTEPMAISAPLGRGLGLTKIGIHHLRVPPGRRTSYPHAESAEDEFVYVLEGQPDVWIDGILHRLAPGDSVAFPSGTGICHTFINNMPDEVRLLVIGEATKPENRYKYPLNPELEENDPLAWKNAPVRPLGPDDAIPRES